MPLFGKSKSEVELKFKWDSDDQLGAGHFAKVYKVHVRKIDKSKPMTYALKVIDKTKCKELDDIKREVEILESIDHVNVIKLYEVYDEAKKMNLVLELVTGGELLDRIQARSSFTEHDAAEVMRTLCSVLVFLHSKKIVHRDLKPENLLYSNPSKDAILKVADFGLSRVMTEGEMQHEAVGTPSYVAPEVINQEPYDEKERRSLRSMQVDVWAAGVILYVLLCGFPPFYHAHMPTLLAAVSEGKYDFPRPQWDKISTPAKQLINKLLKFDRSKRYSAQEALKDPWMLDPCSAQLDCMKTLGMYNSTRKNVRLAMMQRVVTKQVVLTGGDTQANTAQGGR